MKQVRIVYGFHAVSSRLRHGAATIHEVYVAKDRSDRRMRDLVQFAGEVGVKCMEVDPERLDAMTGHAPHQGVVARAEPVERARDLDAVLDALTPETLFLVLDGVQDPHNLGACLRVADAAGVAAVVAPKDRAVAINATVAKVASGAADTVPYFAVTNLARTLDHMKDAGVWVVGTDSDATDDLYRTKLDGPLALVLGAEGAGLRRLTRERCDALARIPMGGTVASLNLSVAAGICLFEARRRFLST